MTSAENLPRSAMTASSEIILRINVLARGVEAGSENMFLIECIDYIQ